MHESGRTSASPIGIALIIVGVLLALGGLVTTVVVSTTLADERITVSEDACLGGRSVADPVTAYCEAMIIEQHAREATGGLTYAELDREDPLREVAMNGSFLRASLFTSVVAFGVAGMAILLGAAMALTGQALRSLDAARVTSPVRS